MGGSKLTSESRLGSTPAFFLRSLRILGPPPSKVDWAWTEILNLLLKTAGHVPVVSNSLKHTTETSETCSRARVILDGNENVGLPEVG